MQVYYCMSLSWPPVSLPFSCDRLRPRAVTVLQCEQEVFCWNVSSVAFKYEFVIYTSCKRGQVTLRASRPAFAEKQWLLPMERTGLSKLGQFRLIDIALVHSAV